MFQVLKESVCCLNWKNKMDDIAMSSNYTKMKPKVLRYQCCHVVPVTSFIIRLCSSEQTVAQLCQVPTHIPTNHDVSCIFSNKKQSDEKNGHLNKIRTTLKSKRKHLWEFLVQPMSYHKSSGGGGMGYDYYCSPAPGGNQEVLASLLGDAHVAHHFTQSIIFVLNACREPGDKNKVSKSE